MYGITLSHDGSQQTIQFGLREAASFVDLDEAFGLVNDDLYGQGTGLAPSDSDPAWASLKLALGAGLELHLTRDGDDFLLYISDAETGSSTTTGAKSLADVFAFATYWAAESFE